MRIITKQTDLANNRSTVVVEHNGEELSWCVAFLDITTRKRRSLFEQDSSKIEYDPYELINEYWEYLPKAQQAQIFDVYRRIKNVFNSVFDPKGLEAALVPLVEEMYSLHDLTNIKFWVDFKRKLRMPTNDPNLLTEYDTVNASKIKRERTYLLSDYTWLVVLSIAIRPMIPVWGDFIDITHKTVGTTWKEYRAYRLLNHSSVFESAPMNKLREYVRSNTRPDIVKVSAIYRGVSTEEFPEWMLGLVVVRKLGCLDVSGEDTSVSCVNTVYGFIVHKLKNVDTSFNGAISEKIFEGAKSEGENNLSTLEGYRTPREYSDGEIEPFAVFAENTVEVARKICPDIPVKLVREAIASVNKSGIAVPLPVQVVLMQLAVKKVLPHQALRLSNHEAIMSLMAVSQAVYWHKGYRELSALVSAKPLPKEGVLSLGGSDHRTRIPPDLLRELEALFPYSRRLTSKPKQEDMVNVGKKDVETIEKSLSSNGWILTLPNDWVAELNKNENNRRYYVPTDIKVKLAQVVISVIKREF